MCYNLDSEAREIRHFKQITKTRRMAVLRVFLWCAKPLRFDDTNFSHRLCRQTNDGRIDERHQERHR